MRRLLSVLFREILYFLATGPVQRQRQQRNDKRLIRAIEKLSDSYSQKIQRNMRLLLSIAVVCLITAADAKDAALLGTGEAIRLPVLGAPISFIAFFAVGPLVMVILLVYLHVIYGHWLHLERYMEQLSGNNGEIYVQRTATLFFP